MPTDAAIDLEQKVAFLKQPDVYPDQPDEVETVETHLAYVFLTDDFAYKLKKPISRYTADLSTLESRRASNEREIELNRRLAPDVYLGLVALTHTPNDGLRLGGDGDVVDWLVKTRRLPAHRMLDHIIVRGQVREDELRRAAVHLAEFYRDAEPVDLSPEAYRDRLLETIDTHHEELTTPGYDLPAEQVHAVAEALRAFIRDRAPMLDARVRDGRVIDAHGDLKPEHICLTEPPVIYDSLEFDRALRIMDPADELALLALESQRMEAPLVGNVFFDTYRTVTGDDPPQHLVAFYKSHRAYLRARIAIRHTEEPMEAAPEQWRAESMEYLLLARSYIDRARAQP